jgi:hypothetical protein
MRAVPRSLGTFECAVWKRLQDLLQNVTQHASASAVERYFRLLAGDYAAMLRHEGHDARPLHRDYRAALGYQRVRPVRAG